MNPSAFHTRLTAGLRARLPPEDSEDSCLSDSDEEHAPTPGDEDSGGDESSDNRSSGDEDWDQDRDACTGSPAAKEESATSTKRKRPKVAWKTVNQSQSSAKDVPEWQANLPDSETIRLPIDYFRRFFDADLLDFIVRQSNLYCVQQNPNHALGLGQKELEQFIGTVLYMSIFHLPRFRMYWSSACRVQQVADVMPRDRWEEIKRFIHFTDNTATSYGDRLFKIRPLIDHLLPKFQALPQDQMLCVDEQLVPFKGRSVLKQYIPKKPYKWGYKIFVLCDSKGLVHSFDVFTGETAPGGASGNAVLKLAQVIDGSVNHLLYFDDRFSSVDLFVALAKRGIPALGAVQQSRLQGCGFSSDTELKKKGRGTFEERQAEVDGVEIRAVRWLDSRAVTVASTFASAQPVYITERWDRKLKRKVSVERPSIVTLYEKFTGGGDALEAMISCNRIHIRSKKYYHRFFFHFLDMVIVNSWLLYRRDCESMSVPRKKQKDLLDFRTSIAQALCMQGKDLWTAKRGWPPLDVEEELETKKRRGTAKAIPPQEVRSDAVGHWPTIDSARQRCKFPKCPGHSSIKCAKCNVHLCLNKNKNCFCAFHE